MSGRNLPELAYVRGRITTPLLANEASWTRWDQLAVIQHRAADAVSVDNQMDGGLSNLRHGAAMCEVAGLADRSPLPYVDGRLAAPDAPGIGVELDPDRVARSAERYEREADVYAFHDPSSVSATPVLPKF